MIHEAGPHKASGPEADGGGLEAAQRMERTALLWPQAGARPWMANVLSLCSNAVKHPWGAFSEKFVLRFVLWKGECFCFSGELIHTRAYLIVQLAEERGRNKKLFL